MNYLLLSVIAFTLFPSLEANAQKDKYAATTIGRKTRPGKPPQFSLYALQGKWQEYSRANANTKMKEYIQDTLYMEFKAGNKVEVQEGNSATITGTADIGKDDYLNTGASDYRIVSMDGNEMVLDDFEGHLRYLKKVSLFYAEVNTAVTPVLADKKDSVVEITSANLIHSWFAYRRAAAPGAVKVDDPIIRNIIIKSNNGNNYQGNIDFTQEGELVTESCNINFTGNNIVIVSQSKKWNGTVYKCTAGELVFGKKGELVYYFKPQ